MISERDAKRIYPANTPVLRKGDKGWKSDAGRELELAATVPGLESTIVTAHAHRPRDRGLDPSLPPLDGLEVGTLYQVVSGRDVVVYEARASGWHRRYTEKNAAL